MTKVVCRAADKQHALQSGGCWFGDMPATAQTTAMDFGITPAITVTLKIFRVLGSHSDGKACWQGMGCTLMWTPFDQFVLLTHIHGVQTLDGIQKLLSNLQNTSLQVYLRGCRVLLRSQAHSNCHNTAWQNNSKLQLVP